MRKIGLIGLVAGAWSVGAIGLAGPAQADDHGWGFGGPDVNYGYQYWYPRNYNPWLNQITAPVKVPQVDTSVRH
jgi:hypothetical protein